VVAASISVLQWALIAHCGWPERLTSHHDWSRDARESDVTQSVVRGTINSGVSLCTFGPSCQSRVVYLQTAGTVGTSPGQCWHAEGRVVNCNGTGPVGSRRWGVVCRAHHNYCVQPFSWFLITATTDPCIRASILGVYAATYACKLNLACSSTDCLFAKGNVLNTPNWWYRFLVGSPPASWRSLL